MASQSAGHPACTTESPDGWPHPWHQEMSSSPYGRYLQTPLLWTLETQQGGIFQTLALSTSQLMLLIFLLSEMQVAGHIRLLKHFYFKPEDQISSLYAIHVQGSPLTVLPHGICPLLPLHESTVAEACPTQLTGGR